MRLTLTIVSLSVGSLAFTQGCGSSPRSSGLWSCFDTGTQIACTHLSALSTADRDVNGDGVPDHFVCADDDDDDGHDRGRDHDVSGVRSGGGSDEDHDGLDDDLDCDHRHECESLSNDANPDRHHGELEDDEAEHHDDGDDDADGGHHNRGPGGGGGPEIHDEHTCTAP
jgi:hypothetical protein